MDNKITKIETIEIRNNQVIRTQIIEIDGCHFDRMLRPIRIVGV
jgi:hypothetical protein